MTAGGRTGLPDLSLSPLTQLILGCGLILVFVLVSKLYFDQYLEIRRVYSKLEAEQARQNQFTDQIDGLKTRIELLKTDDGVELIAREKLRLVKSDEVLVIAIEK